MAKRIIKGLKNSQRLRITMDREYTVEIAVGDLPFIRPVVHGNMVHTMLETMVRENRIAKYNGSGISSYYYDEKMNQCPFQVEFFLL